jgi:hypothetical protein
MSKSSFAPTVKILIAVQNDLDRLAEKEQELQAKKRSQFENEAIKPGRIRKKEERELQRELDRLFKERSKLEEDKRAALEVCSFEDQLGSLLSIHKQVKSNVDWGALSSSLQPHLPPSYSESTLKYLLETLLTQRSVIDESQLAKASRRDSENYKSKLLIYEKESEKWRTSYNISNRVLIKDSSAYGEAVSNFGNFTDLREKGVSIFVKSSKPDVVECLVTVDGLKFIPTEAKSLTASGKVSVKRISNTRFHEIYQDYVCGCCLRVARELFVILPVSEVIITVEVEDANSSTGHRERKPILSVILEKDKLSGLKFSDLDPSDAIESFRHRGDVKTSKKTGSLVRIEPFSIHEIQNIKDLDAIEKLRLEIERLRSNIE